MWTLKDKAVSRLTPEQIDGRKFQLGHLLMLKLEMTFTDGTQDIAVSTFVKTRDEVKRSIKQNLDKLNEQEAVQQEIADGTFTHEDEVVEPTEEEKAAEAAKQEWLTDYRKLQKAKELKELKESLGKKMTDAEQARFTELVDRVDTNFKDEYLAEL